MENWININENYQCSNLGKIRNRNTFVVLKPWRSGKGYQKVGCGKERERYFVHRLVAEAFCVKPTEEYLVVHHINGDKKDNSSSNLLWCSQKQNVLFAKLGNPPLERLIELGLV